MGNMIPDALCQKTMVLAITVCFLTIYSNKKTMNPKSFLLTAINRTPIHMRLGEGNGNNKRPTPYIATAKK
jgi:hypothetical protein